MSRLFVASNADKIVIPSVAWVSRLSASFWFYLTSLPPTVGSGYAFLANSTGFTGLTGYRFAYEKTGASTYKLTFYYTQVFGSPTVWSVTVTLSLNAWHHVVWTIERGSGTNVVVCYLDGAALVPIHDSGGANDQANVSSFGVHRLGAWNDTSATDTWFLDGRLGEVALLGDICSPVLSAGEALNLYRGAYFNEMRPGIEYEGAWPLEGLFDPEPDWSGNERHSASISGTSPAPNPPTAVYPPWAPSLPTVVTSGGGGSLSLGVSVLVEPIVGIGLVPASSCPDDTGFASRPPEPVRGS
jgi:hypothetical protein